MCIDHSESMKSRTEEMKGHERLADRLVQILIKLNAGDALDIATLAEEFKTSQRTILRDFDRFRATGLVLEKDKETKKIHLSVKSLGKLNIKDLKRFADVSGVADLYPSLNPSFLKELLDQQNAPVYSAKGNFFEDAVQFKSLFDSISKAIQEYKHIAFNYNHEPRVVQPYRLIHHHGSWYLAAVRKHQLRTYRLSRMTQNYDHHELLSFKPDPDVLAQLENENSIWFGQEKSEVVLSVHADVAMHFKQRALFPEQQIVKELKDGSLLISSQISHQNQIMPLIRYWIPHVKVVNPQQMQSEIEVGLKKYLGL